MLRMMVTSQNKQKTFEFNVPAVSSLEHQQDLHFELELSLKFLSDRGKPAVAAAGRRRYWKCACTLPRHLCYCVQTFPTQIIVVTFENFHKLR